jgi:hypothetical protein
MGEKLSYQYIYIEFKLVEQKPKTSVYHVLNKRYGDVLGTIKWYAQWRQYCFVPSLTGLREMFADEFLYPDRFYEKNELQAKLKNILDKADKGLTVFSAGCMLDITDFIRKLMLEMAAKRFSGK